MDKDLLKLIEQLALQSNIQSIELRYELIDERICPILKIIYK